jgi:hypothetical protein
MIAWMEACRVPGEEEEKKKKREGQFRGTKERRTEDGKKRKRG